MKARPFLNGSTLWICHPKCWRISSTVAQSYDNNVGTIINARSRFKIYYCFFFIVITSWKWSFDLMCMCIYYCSQFTHVFINYIDNGCRFSHVLWKLKTWNYWTMNYVCRKSLTEEDALAMKMDVIFNPPSVILHWLIVSGKALGLSILFLCVTFLKSTC